MKIKLVAALLVCVAIGSAFAAPANAAPKPGTTEKTGDDKKTLPGTACMPKLAHIGLFEYQYTSLVNISSDQGFAYCPVLRDHVSTDVPGEVDKLRIYVKRSDRTDKAFTCWFTAVNPITQTSLGGNAVVSYDVGVHTMVLGPLDYVGSAADVVYVLQCWVPAQSAILGYYWEEDLGTDGEGE